MRQMEVSNSFSCVKFALDVTNHPCRAVESIEHIAEVDFVARQKRNHHK